MSKQRCRCGVVYRFAESALGKRGKCKHCGEVFLLTGEYETAMIPDADELTSFGVGVADGDHGVSAMPPDFDDAAAHPDPRVTVENQQSRGYGQDLLSTLLFPLSPGNWATCGVIGVALILLPAFGLVPVVGWLVGLCVLGYFAAYRFAVLASAAAGEEDLPTLESDDLSVDGIAGALFKWIGSWAVVLVPAVVFSAVAGRAVPAGLAHGLGGVMSSLLAEPVAVGLFGAGMFMWPMVILCVVLGGFSSLLRLDLILRTIARTFSVYLLTVGIVFGAQFTGTALDGLRFAGAPMIVHALGVATSIYAEIVAMRAIGLYYHHFKHRFLWDWE